MTKTHQKSVSSKPEKCPFCRSDEIKEIIYGLPLADFDYSQYIPGGGCATPGSPRCIATTAWPNSANHPKGAPSCNAPWGQERKLRSPNQCAGAV